MPVSIAVNVMMKILYDFCTRSNRRKNVLFNDVTAWYIFLATSNKD